MRRRSAVRKQLDPPPARAICCGFVRRRVSRARSLRSHSDRPGSRPGPALSHRERKSTFLMQDSRNTGRCMRCRSPGRWRRSSSDDRRADSAWMRRRRVEAEPDAWRRPRVFAGDAVHLVVPTGGLGMNTGVGDRSISWKLRDAARMGRPEPSALARIERRQIGDHVGSRYASLAGAPGVRTAPRRREGRRRARTFAVKRRAAETNEMMAPSSVSVCGIKSLREPAAWSICSAGACRPRPGAGTHVAAGRCTTPGTPSTRSAIRWDPKPPAAPRRR